MVLLQEYTHWDKLVAPVMPPAYISVSRQKSTLDYVYGVFFTRLENDFIAPRLALWNGDSYAWLANEVWWTQACSASHGPLTAPLRWDN